MSTWRGLTKSSPSGKLSLQKGCPYRIPGGEVNGLLEGSTLALQMREDVLQEVQRGPLGVLEGKRDKPGSSPGEDSRDW